MDESARTGSGTVFGVGSKLGSMILSIASTRGISDPHRSAIKSAGAGRNVAGRDFQTLPGAGFPDCCHPLTTGRIRPQVVVMAAP